MGRGRLCMILGKGLKGGRASKKDLSQCVVWLNQLANYTCQVALFPSKSFGSMFIWIRLSFGKEILPVSLSPRKLLTSSWSQSYLLPHPLSPKGSKGGCAIGDGFHGTAVGHHSIFQIRSPPPPAPRGWSWNRLLLHNLECGPLCFSCHHFMRPVGSFEKEW